MKSRDRTKYKGRRESGTFLRLPTEVLDSPKFRALPHKAKALLLDLGAQYRGHNNGDQCATWSLMQRRGWRSKGTLQSALRELLDAGMIEQTRQGGRHVCSLYAFTWLPIDHCGGKLDVSETRVASGLWRGDDTKPSDAQKRDAHPDQRGKAPRPSGQSATDATAIAPPAVHLLDIYQAGARRMHAR
ncbi:hypothetical protein MBSD_n2578 [Mizugakiibacter sediminis]|uniref:Helix-turn-helix domain-containing protein n=1 Tax=Mizugakiibacter sediminis TaxID=1475481 RepID=A0A0K8QQW2_9GAMM|nr:hypothetical protein [Mizugakiibacter sediminis]GAP67260.1 hypothetical protein MBSD_n2578 [Mizugakiibacter sediminis]